MSRISLTWGILSRMVVRGAGSGAFFGGVYAVLLVFATLLFFSSTEVGRNSSAVIGCFVIVVGFAVGGGIGMFLGFVLGIFSGLVTALISILFPALHAHVHRYRVVVRLLCACVAGISPLVLSLVDFTPFYSWEFSTLYLLAGPTITAMVAFWFIGGSVALWVEVARLSGAPNLG